VTQRDDAEDTEDARDDDGGSLDAIPRASARRRCRRWVANVEGVAPIASALRARIDGDGLDVGRGRRE
jgi:hypothetical protein